VDGAIHRGGGPAILEECRAIVARQGGCPTGEAVITGAGNLPARNVIHTVGPVWRGGDSGEREALASCYRRSLELAVEHGCRTVAFPNISTGVYGFPKAEAARIAVAAVASFLEKAPDMEKVIFVCFDAESFKLVQEAVEQTRHTPGP
jgi:O-acetyl-ADP-ribose deacetylase